MLVQHNDDDEDEQEDSEPLSAETVSEMENVNGNLFLKHFDFMFA